MNNHKLFTDLDRNKMLKSKPRAVQSASFVHNFEIFLVMAAGQIKFVFSQHFVGWRSKIETYRIIQCRKCGLFQFN